MERAFFNFDRWAKITITAAASKTAPTATPTPIPAFAPVLRLEAELELVDTESGLAHVVDAAVLPVVELVVGVEVADEEKAVVTN